MNREQIEAFCDKPNAALTDISKREFLQLCDLALRGLEAGEPVVYITESELAQAADGFGMVTVRDKPEPGEIGLYRNAPASAPTGMVPVPREFIKALVQYNDNARSFFQIANRIATELGTHALQTNFGAFAESTGKMLKETHDITNKARETLSAAPEVKP